VGQADLPTPARGPTGGFLLGVALAAGLLCAGSPARPQNPSPPEIQSQEGATQAAQPTFRLRAQRNLVTVKVVVRDRNDRPVGDLHKEDFRVLDDGKPQDILGFTIETGLPTPGTAPLVTAERTGEVPGAPAKALAQRFVILHFDDYHMEPEGIARTRVAAWRYINTAVWPQDRVAIYTATGKDQLDFTDDREKLHDWIFKLSPRPRALSGCPNIEPYEAYLVTTKEPRALAIVHAEDVK